VTVVADPGRPRPVGGRLDQDEIETQREVWQRRPVGEPAAVEEAERRIAEPPPLAPVERLFGDPEVTSRPPADLDCNERRGRSGVDGNDVELATTDVDVAGKDRPPGGDEVVGDGRFGRVAQELTGGPHRGSLPSGPAPAITRRAALKGRGNTGDLHVLTMCDMPPSESACFVHDVHDFDTNVPILCSWCTTPPATGRNLLHMVTCCKWQRRGPSL
jgi:hypothetical protein